MIRFGILSISSIVPRFIEGVLASLDASVVALYSRDLKKAQTMATQYGIAKAMDHLEELLKDEEVDAVYVAGANFLHYEHVRLALSYGKHVLCEKPFVLEASQAESLFELARQSGLFLMEAQKCVFLPVTQELKHLIDTKVIGDIRYISMCSSFPLPGDENHWMRKASGGCLYGSAAYTIEPLRYLFDEAFSHIQGQFILNQHACDLQCSLSFQIGNQIHVTSIISMLAPNDNIAIYYGTLGKIEVKHYWKARSLKIIDAQGNEKLREFPCLSEFTYEINHFTECITTSQSESPIMSKAMSVETCKIVDELKQQKA